MKNSKASDKAFNPTEILERISDAFVALDKDWCYTYMNKKAGEIFQRDPQEMIGKHIWTEFPEGVGQPFYKAYYEAMAEQEYIYLEEYFAPWEIWFENHIYPSPEGLSIYFRDITERKNAERLNNLIQKENEALINSTSDILWSVSTDYTLIAANKAFVKGLKDNGGFMIKPGDNVLSSEHFQEDYLHYWKGIYQKGLSGESVMTEVYTPQTQSLDYLWFELKIDPIFSEHKICGIACSMRDITERKKAEEKLQKSEELFSSAFHASPAGIIITQLSDGKIINANDSFLAIFELSREEAVGKTAEELNLLNPEERAKLAQHQIATGGLKNFELLSQSKSGKPIILLFSSKLLELDGEACLITTLIDITERKKAEAEVQKLATIVQRSREFIGIAGLDAKGIYLNDGGKKIVGLNRDITTTTMFDFFDPKDLEQFQTKVIPAIQKTGRWVGNINLRHFQTGELIAVWMDIFHIFDPVTNEPIAFASVITDIRERKKTEQEILQMNEQLRNLTSHLQNIREEERTHIAREIHDELGQYLTAIKMDAAWLRNKCDSTDETMHEKLMEMISLIDETVGTVRRISGELRPAMLDDLGLIAAVEWKCNNFERRNSIPNKFTSSVEELNLERNSAINIYRIIQEAFNNIIKHAQATAVETDVTKTDTVLLIKIKDNGIGFDETQQKNKNSFGLLGMRERAMMMGGTLTIESEKDKGTRVIIELPLKTTSPPAPLLKKERGDVDGLAMTDKTQS